MTQSAKELLATAAAMPERERAWLAASLIDTLEGESDPNAAASWEDEIRRRLEDIRAGNVQMIPWEEARAIIRGDDVFPSVHSRTIHV